VRLHRAVFILLTGCASVGALQPAQTLGKNNIQVGLEVSEQALVSKDVLTVYPMMGVSARYGLLDRLDVGIRFGPSAFEAQVKVQLTPREPNRLIVSVAPLATLDWADNEGVALRFYNFAIPVLIGIPFGEGHQVIMAPLVNDLSYFVGAGCVVGFINNIGLGLSAGVALHLWKVWFIPEVGVLQPMFITAQRVDLPELSGAQFRLSKTTVQANISVLWGNI
jgi:hypothetical protein